MKTGIWNNGKPILPNGAIPTHGITKNGPLSRSIAPEAHCGLPGEEDCGPEEALDAVGRYLDGYAGPGMDTDAWTVRGSKFLLDHIDENDPYPMPGYLAGTHVWELLVYFEMTGELALITVDAASAEVIGDEPAEENGDWAV